MADRDFSQVPSVSKLIKESTMTAFNLHPLLLIDTAGCDMEESQDEISLSRSNSGEADLVFNHVQCILRYGIQESDIAIISPYNEQVELLRRKLQVEHPLIEIKSVDGFQGREKEVVIISLVRSNKKREVVR